jgi:hypothetical protein
VELSEAGGRSGMSKQAREGGIVYRTLLCINCENCTGVAPK